MEGIILAKWIAVALAGYLVGNFSTGITISRMVAKDDVRKYGSGGTGATNMFRFMGMKASLLTLLGDLVKAAIAALFGLLLLGRDGALLGGLMAVVGHNWPVFYKFKGGRGVAASAGAILVAQPVVALILIPLALLGIRVLKIVSVISMTTLSVYLVITLIFWWGDWALIAFAALLWAMTILGHIPNIKRLLSGEEGKNSLSFDKKA